MSKSKNNNQKKSFLNNIGTISAVVGAIAAIIAAIFGQNGLIGVFNKITGTDNNPSRITNTVNPNINVNPNIQANPDIKINNNSNEQDKKNDNSSSNSWIPPTPKSPDEAALYKWLEALRTGNNLQAAESVSNYSLSFHRKSKEDLLTDYKLSFNKGTNNIKYNEIAGKKIINNESKLLELVVYFKNEEEKIFSESQKYIVHKDEDNIWRVNEFGFVDYRNLKKQSTFNNLAGITIVPTLVARYLNKLIIYFNLSTVNQEGRYNYRGIQAKCLFQNGNSLGVVNFNNTYIKIDGFKSTYPTRCIFPEMMDSKIYSDRGEAFMLGRLSMDESFYMPQLSIDFKYK